MHMSSLIKPYLAFINKNHIILYEQFVMNPPKKHDIGKIYLIWIYVGYIGFIRNRF